MEDGYDPGYQLMSDQEIVETIMLDKRIQIYVTHAQACAAFECALEWLELQGDIQTQLI